MFRVLSLSKMEFVGRGSPRLRDRNIAAIMIPGSAPLTEANSANCLAIKRLLDCTNWLPVLQPAVVMLPKVVTGVSRSGTKLGQRYQTEQNA